MTPHIYLPIAEVSIDLFLLLGLGAGIGFLSGLLGVGGGFLLTPLLIFLGIPASVAVATGANQLVGASVSGMIAHWRRGNVDLKMGLVLLAGGFVGSTLGVFLFALLRKLGHIDLAISLLYVLFLGVIGILMMVESLGSLVKRRRPARRKLHRHGWIHDLPLKMRFRKSRLYISAILPLTIGFVVGVLAAIMGVGGGFIMVPAMIYILGMPTSVVVGTSLFQVIFVAANATFLQALFNQTVDVELALVLLLGGVVGAQIGAQTSSRLEAENLRAILAIMVLIVSAKLAFDLTATPAQLYSLAGGV